MTRLKLGLIQSHLHWEDPAANRAHFEAKLFAMAAADLIVLPEMFSTGFSMNSEQHAEAMTDKTVVWLQSQADELKTAICGSVMIREAGQFYNRFLLCKPNETPIQYDKKHLFRMSGEHQHFSAGSERLVVELKGVRICPQVCYDLRFPVFSRNIFSRNKGDYDLLLYVANWPAKRRQHWRTLLTARAIENQAYVVGLNRVGTDGNQVDYSGDSGLIHPNGKWLSDLSSGDTSAIIEIDLADLEQYRQDFPAWQDADRFTLED